MIKKLLAIFVLSVFATHLFAEEKSFVIVIPTYNNINFCKKNIESAASQNYENFRIIVCDDASTDGTGQFLDQYVKEHDLNARVTIIHNTTRIGALANYYQAIWLCKPEEIMVNLDGDDWLHNLEVLRFLNEVYADGSVWLTYGQYTFPYGGGYGAGQLPGHVIASNSYRAYHWVTTHLRTFYAALFQKIKKEDLLYNGEFYPMTGDLAMMFPMLEMAGKHSLFTDKLMYVYNTDGPMHDGYTNPGFQVTLEGIIRGQKRYAPLEKLIEE